jgi:hypothetical protein
VENYKESLLKERQRQAEIKRKYGIKSLNNLIGELDNDLIKLYERKAKGEKVEIAIYNKEERKKHYEKALEELKIEIERECALIISKPKLLGAVYVRPKVKIPEMFPSEEIEKIGMEMAMEYERQQNRLPEDVSKESLGFDIRSTDQKTGEIRYIEVKARAGEGDVALTPNEWMMAKRFKDQYYLYVVANAVTNPTLYIIRNPAENLKPQEMVEVVRFIVPVEEWKSKKMEEWRN